MKWFLMFLLFATPCVGMPDKGCRLYGEQCHADASEVVLTGKVRFHWGEECQLSSPSARFIQSERLLVMEGGKGEVEVRATLSEGTFILRASKMNLQFDAEDNPVQAIAEGGIEWYLEGDSFPYRMMADKVCVHILPQFTKNNLWSKIAFFSSSDTPIQIQKGKQALFSGQGVLTIQDMILHMAGMSEWQGEGFTLHAPGEVMVHLLDQIVSANSGAEAASPLVCKTAAGEMRCRKAQASYEWVGENLQWKNVQGEGEVVWLSLQEESALADRLEYRSNPETLILIGSKNSPVLFVDRKYDAQMSAPRVRFTRNEKTGQIEAKGEGRVRLHFLQEEIKRLSCEGIFHKKIGR